MFYGGQERQQGEDIRVNWAARIIRDIRIPRLAILLRQQYSGRACLRPSNANGRAPIIPLVDIGLFRAHAYSTFTSNSERCRGCYDKLCFSRRLLLHGPRTADGSWRGPLRI